MGEGCVGYGFGWHWLWVRVASQKTDNNKKNFRFKVLKFRCIRFDHTQLERMTANRNQLSTSLDYAHLDIKKHEAQEFDHTSRVSEMCQKPVCESA